MSFTVILPCCAWPAFQIIAETDPAVVTHELNSGEVMLGISDKGGGYINRLYLPGIGDVMGPETARYGRGGQSSIRDALHGGRYNPTQAGFSDPAGTICEVESSDSGSKLTVMPRPCCLFRGDGKFDFTEWENLADDRYKEVDGRLDWDTIDERDLVGKQATEVTSEFDYYCTYEDVHLSGSNGITIPVIRHYFEYRYVRNPGHCIEQHIKGPLFNPVAGEVTDISVDRPLGQHAAAKGDMSIVTLSMSIRMDRLRWTPEYLGIVGGGDIERIEFVKRSDQATVRNFHTSGELAGRATAYRVPKAPFAAVPLIIYSDSVDPDQAGALGLYYPDSDVNLRSLIGVSRENGDILYKEDRRLQMELRDTPMRTSKMQWCGFRGRLLGILNPTRLPEDQYEAIRGEFYLLYGTPREILENARRIQEF